MCPFPHSHPTQPGGGKHAPIHSLPAPLAGPAELRKISTEVLDTEPEQLGTCAPEETQVGGWLTNPLGWLSEMMSLCSTSYIYIYTKQLRFFGETRIGRLIER